MGSYTSLILRLRRFLAFPVAEKFFVLKVLGIVVLVRLALWTLPFKTVLAWVKRRLYESPKHAHISAGKIIWAVVVSSRLVPRASCLTQALSAQLVLARYGFQSDLRIGVARDAQGVFEAHAWLEQEGQVILGGRHDLSRYAPLPSLELYSKVS